MIASVCECFNQPTNQPTNNKNMEQARNTKAMLFIEAAGALRNMFMWVFFVMANKHIYYLFAI